MGEAADMTKIRVTGMTCGHCEKAVERALAAVPGVTQVSGVNRERQEAIVEGDADPAALIAAVEEEGYHAEVVL
jgi:copper chaperone